jgi:hypothetical protein
MSRDRIGRLAADPVLAPELRRAATAVRGLRERVDRLHVRENVRCAAAEVERAFVEYADERSRAGRRVVS